MVIYKTTNLVNGRAYIGKDKMNMNHYLGSGLALKRAIEKYGKENFKKEILEECDSYEHMNEREEYWIDHFNAVEDPKYYNMKKGGQGGVCPTCLTEEFREKMKRIIVNPMEGKSHTDEAKAKQRAKAKGRYTLKWYQDRHGDDEGRRLYEERCAKRSKQMGGVVVSKEELTELVANGCTLKQIGEHYGGLSEKWAHRQIKKHFDCSIKQLKKTIK